MRCSIAARTFMVLATLPPGIVNLSAGQAQPPPPASWKQTRSGLQVAVLGVERQGDAFRFGACPPGDSGIPDKVVVAPGQVAFIVRVAVKVPALYEGSGLPKPVLQDSEGNAHKLEMGFVPAPKLVRDLRGTGTELRCEFPFVLWAGKRPKQLEFEDVVLDLTGRPEP